MQIVKRGTKGKRGFYRKERRRRPTSQVDIFNIIQIFVAETSGRG